jgi:photosystem II stability/assembly factor-like uncharacterized protein
MAMSVYAGTAGTSMWSSEDRGETWQRPYTDLTLYMESRVWSLTSQPANGSSVILGTDRGIYRWHGPEKKWSYLPSPFDSVSVFTIAQSPHDKNVILAGMQPAALYRSADAGGSWDQVEVDFPTECPFISIPRVTQILFDPIDPQLVWVGVEIGGVHRSRDAGKTWTKTSSGLISEDLHGLAVIRQEGRRKLFATTNKGLHVSHDDGDNWTHRPLATEWAYLRAVVPKAGSDNVLFLTNGDGPPGSNGRLLRSRDYGETWEDAGLPGIVNSTPWCVAVHPDEPDLIFVCTNLGQLFRSEDGGETWSKLKRELGEIRSLILRPSEVAAA